MTNQLPRLLTRHIAEIIGETQLQNHYKHFPPQIIQAKSLNDINSIQVQNGMDLTLKLYREKNLKPLSLYWGTATTSSPHFGYFLPLLKLRDFLKLNLNVTILLADIHAALDKMEFDQIEYSKQYYHFVLKEMLKGLKLDPEVLSTKEVGYLRFRTGSEFQLSPKYAMDLYKMSHISTIDGAKSASAMVVKQTENPVLSSVMYPLLQALDEEYLDADIQFGGVDQRKIFMFARETLPRIGYRKRSYLMNPLIPALSKDGKMSSSDPSSKIDLTDSDEMVQRKLRKAYSIDGEVESNGMLAILQHIIFPYLETYQDDLLVERPQKYGGNIKFTSYDALEDAFRKQEVVSSDLKENVAREIIRMIDPVRTKIQENIQLYNKAYNISKEVKKEKTKNKGGIFTLYIDEQIALLQAQNPALSETELMKQHGSRIRDQFKRLTEEEKKRLQDKLASGTSVVQ